MIARRLDPPLGRSATGCSCSRPCSAASSPLDALARLGGVAERRAARRRSTRRSPPASSRTFPARPAACASPTSSSATRSTKGSARPPRPAAPAGRRGARGAATATSPDRTSPSSRTTPIAGGDLDKGLRYARRAGDRALALLAYEEAARLYAMALEALDSCTRRTSAARCELLLVARRGAGTRREHGRAAKERFLDAAAIARRLGLPRELARAAAGYGGRFMWARGRRRHSSCRCSRRALAALADERRRAAGQAPRPPRRRAARRAVARSPRRAQPGGGRARPPRRGTPPRSRSRSTAALAAIDRPGHGRRVRRARRASFANVAERIGDRERVVNALDHERTRLVMAGDLREAEAALEEGRSPLRRAPTAGSALAAPTPHERCSPLRPAG